MMGWFGDCWQLMMRTKPQYISVLGRKSSSATSSHKVSYRENEKCGRKLSCLFYVAIPFCSISSGILLILSHQSGVTVTMPTMILSLILSAILSICGGLCLSEYVASQSSEVASVYTCAYQNSSEILAFLIGWTWILSQNALVSSFCKILAACLNTLTGNYFQNILEGALSSYAAEIPSVFFILVFTIVTVAGFSETNFWFVLSMPLVFVLVTVVNVLTCLSTKNLSPFENLKWYHIQDIDKVLSTSALCSLFYSGPQSIVRVPTHQVYNKAMAILGPINAIAFAISCIFVVFHSDDLGSSDQHTKNVVAVLDIICLSVVAIETFFPLHLLFRDMANDGLLFRNLGKKYKLCWFPVRSPLVQLLTLVITCSLAIFVRLEENLMISVLFPLFVHCVVPILILRQRYHDNNSWQYEPMFQSTAKMSRRSRTKTEEFQFVTPGFDITECQNDSSTACMADHSQSESSSDTDIDSIVQQYKEQAKIANSASLDEPVEESYIPEPTNSTYKRAKYLIYGMLVTYTVLSLTLNFVQIEQDIAATVVVLFCMLLSTLFQALLVCLPQNQNRGVSNKMPWVAGLAMLFANILLVHCLMDIWKVALGWIVVGFIVYFVYGMKNSTAANSFYNMRSTHIALHPLPNYGNNCITQIIPSQRKSSKTKSKKRIRHILQ